MKVYLDYNSTVPSDPEHLREVFNLVEQADGNPSNIHYAGRAGKAQLEKSRRRRASLLKIKPATLFFNSGATEGNNHIIQSFVESNLSESPCIILSEGEHSAVYETVRKYEKLGMTDVAFVPLKPSGQVCVEGLIEAVNSVLSKNKDTPLLVTTIYINNETGVINPVEEIAKKLNAINQDIFYHVDAVQALGKVRWDFLENSAVSSMVVSAHKIGGLKGIGALYLKNSSLLAAQLLGGGQERNLRSGTENLPGVISFGLRAEYLEKNSDWLDNARILFDLLVHKLMQIGGVVIHGDLNLSSKTTVNFHIENKTLETINLQLDMADIAVSNGSACSSGLPKPSRVLVAMGIDKQAASNSLRVSLGESTNEDEINYFVETLRNALV